MKYFKTNSMNFNLYNCDVRNDINNEINEFKSVLNCNIAMCVA